jgi:hypothetical protein
VARGIVGEVRLRLDDDPADPVDQEQRADELSCDTSRVAGVERPP